MISDRFGGFMKEINKNNSIIFFLIRFFFDEGTKTQRFHEVR